MAEEARTRSLLNRLDLMNAQFQTENIPKAAPVPEKEAEDPKYVLLLEKIASLESQLSKKTDPDPHGEEQDSEEDGSDHEHITTPDGKTVSYLQWLTRGNLI